jgi:hypothetical protein
MITPEIPTIHGKATSAQHPPADAGWPWGTRTAPPLPPSF